VTAVFEVTPAAFGSSFTSDEVSNLRRYVHLSEQLRRCRYFTEEERSMHVEMDAGVTTKWEQTLPDAGAVSDVPGGPWREPTMELSDYVDPPESCLLYCNPFEVHWTH
jgi:hypothetical protein